MARGERMNRLPIRLDLRPVSATSVPEIARLDKTQKFKVHHDPYLGTARRSRRPRQLSHGHRLDVPTAGRRTATELK